MRGADPETEQGNMESTRADKAHATWLRLQ
jgi:hypothetical protein